MKSTKNTKRRTFSVILAGNPNVGKSTVFNFLTGMKQHTGNWSGKTVDTLEGALIYKDCEFVLTDLPGTYSLRAESPDEAAAGDVILNSTPDCIIIVADSSSLERNLYLILQILEINTKAVLCLNLNDEAEKKHIYPDDKKISDVLGIPVVKTSARSGKGLEELKAAVYDISAGNIIPKKFTIPYDSQTEDVLTRISSALKKQGIADRYTAVRLTESSSRKKIMSENNIFLSDELNSAFSYSDSVFKSDNEVNDRISYAVVELSEDIFRRCVRTDKKSCCESDIKTDRIVTSRKTGIPIMLLLLAVIFYITIIGANYPSELLSSLFAWIEDRLRDLFCIMNVNAFISGIFIDGMICTLGDVVSVMLPPMAIFFPLFALLEDSGYLPRIAFMLDRLFCKCGTSGKQSLTMMMGFGCNACGITGCRIIGSERERKIAALTNNFCPCNGRFPTLIAIITVFLTGTASGASGSLVCALILLGVIIVGVLASLAASSLLSLTILKGHSQGFILELPPYRRPQFIKTIIRSVKDKTAAVLLRAAVVAVPAGALIWLLANISIGGHTVISSITETLDPFAQLLGLDGVILTAFILGFPANETVLPIMIMIYLSQGTMTDFTSLEQLHSILVSNGWTVTTALCMMIFTVMHFPCSTSCITFYKETKSLKLTFIAFILPTLFGILLCMLTNLIL